MHYRTAESVTPKHPDKMCDQISDGILDFVLRQSPLSRAAIETVGGHGKIFITGEYACPRAIDSDTVHNIVREVTGDPSIVFEMNLAQQSHEIAQGVDTGGAGDQGIMVGYATRETMARIPIEHFLARSLAQHIYAQYPYDGKTQITIDSEDNIVAIVASFQNTTKEQLDECVDTWAKKEMLARIADNAVKHLNPAGNWNIGGFEADAGLTGRKLAVDNYGTRYPIGGGAFSGKDATKVDRSAAYMARYIAVNEMAKSTLLDVTEIEVRLAYAIGVAEPVQATVIHKSKNGRVFLEAPIDRGVYDVTPRGIIEKLKLRDPIYQETAKWGHFGNGFRWDTVGQ